MEDSITANSNPKKKSPGVGKDDQRRFSKWLSIRKQAHLLSNIHTSSASCFSKFRTAWAAHSKDQNTFFLERECYFFLNAATFVISLSFTLTHFRKAYLRIALLGVMIILNIIAPFCRMFSIPANQDDLQELAPSIIAKNTTKKNKLNVCFSVLAIMNVIAAVEIELQKTIVNINTPDSSSSSLFKIEFNEDDDEAQNDALQYITNYSLTFLYSLLLLPRQLPEITPHSLLPLQILGFAYLQIRYQTCLKKFSGWQFSYSVLVFMTFFLRKSLWLCLYKNSRERRLSSQIKDGIMRNIKSFYNNVFELMPQGIAIIDSEKDLVFNNKAIKTLMDCQTQDLVKNIRGIMLKRKGDSPKLPDSKSKMAENSLNSPEPVHQLKKSTTVPDRLFTSKVGQSNLTDMNDFSNNNNNNSVHQRSSRGSQKLQRINKAAGFLQANLPESVICNNIEQIIDELLIFGKKQNRQNNLIKKLQTVISESTQKSKFSADEDQNIIFSNDSISVEFKKNKKNLLLKVIKKELESITQYRLKLLASISHELKTPLNTSINILENLHGEFPDDIYSATIKPALSSNKYLLNVFNDILDYQAIESKTFSYVHSRFDLRELLVECLDIISFQLSYRDLTLSFGFDENIPQFIVSDAARVRQVILNLLSNAMKFTSNGVITLKAALLQNGEIEISVEDTGIGISKQNQTMIFNLCGRREFLQKNSKLQLNTQGAGLGLSVSSQLVRGLSSKQSEMIVQSEEKKGSKFSFWISCQPQSSLQESHLLSQPFMNEATTPGGGVIKTAPSKFSIDNNIHNDIFKISTSTNQPNNNQQYDINYPLKSDYDKRKDSCDISKYSRCEDEEHQIHIPNEFNLRFPFNEEDNENSEADDNFFSNVCFSTLPKDNHMTSINKINFQLPLHTPTKSDNVALSQSRSPNKPSNNNQSNTKIDTLPQIFNGNSMNSTNNNFTFTNIEPGRYLPALAFRYSCPNWMQAMPSMTSLAHIPQQDLAIAAQMDSQAVISAPQTTSILPFNQSQYPDMTINRISAASTQAQLVQQVGMKNDQNNLSTSQQSSSCQQYELVKSPLHYISSSNVASQQSIQNTDHQSSNNRDSFLKYLINSREKNDSIQQHHQQQQNQSKTQKCSCVPFITIDDNQMNLTILQSMIKQLGYTCDLASSGQIGIDTVKNRFNSNKCCKFYAMIFCDIDMPIKNGFQTIDEINKFFLENGLLQQDIPPVTACSALDFPQFREQCRSSGMTYFLPKPVNKVLLNDLIIKAKQYMNI